MKLFLSLIMCTVFAANLFAATPVDNEPADKEQKPPQQEKSVNSSKLQKSTPAIIFTPSEKVGADSAVSFPVDI